jgi:hypothetical protein
MNQAEREAEVAELIELGIRPAEVPPAPIPPQATEAAPPAAVTPPPATPLPETPVAPPTATPPGGQRPFDFTSPGMREFESRLDQAMAARTPFAPFASNAPGVAVNVWRSPIM